MVAGEGVRRCPSRHVYPSSLQSRSGNGPRSCTSPSRPAIRAQPDLAGQPPLPICSRCSTAVGRVPPHPVVLFLHGGPHEQERLSYNPVYDLLVHMGLAVLVPNIRGSTGYGRKYRESIYGKWGTVDLADVWYIAEWLKRQPWADADRVAVIGQSYGGFLALAAATRLKFSWACSITFAAPTDLVSFVEGLAPAAKTLGRALIGAPTQNGRPMLARSPISHVDRLRAPLLMIQGEQDSRVSKAETDRFVERGLARGASISYLVLPGEGHSLTRSDSLNTILMAVTGFLRSHVLS